VKCAFVPIPVFNKGVKLFGVGVVPAKLNCFGVNLGAEASPIFVVKRTGIDAMNALVVGKLSNIGEALCRYGHDYPLRSSRNFGGHPTLFAYSSCVWIVLVCGLELAHISRDQS
jgi:hypothetical protein